MKWKALLYSTPSGQAVVQKFIASLDNSTHAKVLRHIDLLETFGPSLRMPYSRQLGMGLAELRIRGNREVRLFYVFADEKYIYLLHGFVKKSQATPRKELALARQRQHEISAI